jgi:uncharacterized membrane protein YuzA (DUF378 family)
MTSGKCVICKIVTLLAAIGALNWGLVAFLQVDLVAKIAGPMTTGAKVIYGLIAVAGLIKLVSVFGICCPCCKKDASCATTNK